jgi:hypothetical protein
MYSVNFVKTRRGSEDLVPNDKNKQLDVGN